jgi:hypothetical protein
MAREDEASDLLNFSRVLSLLEGAEEEKKNPTPKEEKEKEKS